MEWLTVRDAAVLLGVHDDSVRHYANQGKLPVIKTRSGWRLFALQDVLAFREARLARAQAAAADERNDQ